MGDRKDLRGFDVFGSSIDTGGRSDLGDSALMQSNGRAAEQQSFRRLRRRVDEDSTGLGEYVRRREVREHVEEARAEERRDDDPDAEARPASRWGTRARAREPRGTATPRRTRWRGQGRRCAARAARGGTPWGRGARPETTAGPRLRTRTEATGTISTLAPVNGAWIICAAADYIATCSLPPGP